MSRSNTLLKSKKKVLLAIVSLILLSVLGYFGYTMLNKSNLSSEDASAGVAISTELNGLKLQIESKKTLKKYLIDQGTTWQYTITGKVSSCYKSPEVKVESSKSPVEISVNLVGTNCGKGVRAASAINKTGIFSTLNQSEFSFIVNYSNGQDEKIKNELVKRISTPTFIADVEGFKLFINKYANIKTREKASTYSITGTTVGCYTTSSKVSQTGLHKLTITKSTAKRTECEKTVNRVNETGSYKYAETAKPIADLMVTYYTVGSLQNSNVKPDGSDSGDGGDKVPQKTLTSNGLTLNLLYNGKNSWTYKLTGNLNNSCQTVTVNMTTNEDEVPSRVHVGAEVLTSPYTSGWFGSEVPCKETDLKLAKEGRFTAASTATFTFEATEKLVK